MVKLRFLFLLSLLIFGCGYMMTRTEFYQPITETLIQRDFPTTVNLIKTAKLDNKYGNKEILLYYLDLGFAYHYADLFDSSSLLLTLAEDIGEDLYTKSVTRAFSSLLVNDNVMEYSGEDYELLYCNLFKALNYIQKKQFDEAFVEIRRSNLKLELLNQKYGNIAEKLNEEEENPDYQYQAEEVRFHNSAFARYLSMRMYDASGREDDARIDYEAFQKAFKDQPYVYPFNKPEIKYDPPKGKALFSVVALCGLSPVKEELSLRIRTDKDLDLVQVLYDNGLEAGEEYTHFPFPVGEDFYFKFAIPKIVPRPSYIKTVEISANEQIIGQLSLTEDITKVSQEVFRAKKSLIFLRALFRSISKGLTSHQLKKEADTGGFEGWLKKAAIDIAADLTENADLRCSRLLPGKIYTGDFIMKPGTYDIKVRFLDDYGNALAEKIIPGYGIDSKKLNLIEAFSFQ